VSTARCDGFRRNMNTEQPELLKAAVTVGRSETGVTKARTTSGQSVCPYCGGTSAHLVSSSDVNRKTTDLVFNYFQCAECKLVFLDPPPEDMTAFYKGGYQTIPENLSKLREISKKERYRIDSILKYKQGGRLLEIGPWMGIFSCNAKDAGFDVTTIEMDQNCVDFLRKVVNVTAIQSDKIVKTLDAMNEKFDVIALWHCLEHLPQPWLVLQKAAEKLAPGGILLIAIPNIDSYDFSVLRAKWQHLDAPRHLYFFPIQWLERIRSRIGLQTLELTTSDHLSKIVSRNAWHAQAASRIPIKYVRGIVGLLLYKFAQQQSKGKYSGGGLTAIFTRVSSRDARLH
jgi:2-polyprenyl-3-methyl-5-hydroxy-6-metoxy-1,4-benzoquinol methylase